jgi:pimeloyl-ACP methyl ester carboxylesterase
MKQQIYFAHGNGFPSPCYRKFFSYLSPDFDISYVDKVGHHPDYPVTDNWDFLVQELIQNIEQQYTQPIIGVGHSLGGVLHFMASSQRPDLYRAVIMLDSPVLSRTKSIAVKLMKWAGYIDKITPAARTKSRKESWSNAHEAMTYLQDKSLFATFDPDCLRDYIEHGMEHNAQGVHLRFNREIEYHIYRTLPHNLTRYQHRRAVPTGLLYGKSTHVVRPGDLKYMRSRLHIQTKCTEGGHLFPFEHPAQAANDLRVLIQHLKCSQD